MNAVQVPKRLVEISLMNVALKNETDVIAEGEREYGERLARAAEKIRASGARIIMLTGPSASGKTTSAHLLADELAKDGTPAKVVSLDNFFLGAENYPTLPDGTKDYESPATLNMPEINRCLGELNEKGESDLPVYDFVQEKPAREREHLSLDGGVCIVEGIHALNPELTRVLPEEKLFRIYAGLREEYSKDGRRLINTRDIRLCRRVLRDAAERGHSPEKTLGMWDRVLDGENQYIKIYKNLADLVLDTSFSYELGIIAGLVPQALAATDPHCPEYALMRQTAERFAEVMPLPVTAIPEGSMILKEFYSGAKAAAKKAGAAANCFQIESKL
ncbi:MAG: nucleoside kinase [Faecalibacterium sp.]|nr:nucleoside kinase [Faecalibacterium sp.]